MHGLLFEQAQSTYCCGTEDLREAVTAFLEKRKPVFTARFNHNPSPDTVQDLFLFSRSQ